MTAPSVGDVSREINGCKAITTAEAATYMQYIGDQQGVPLQFVALFLVLGIRVSGV
jgi:small basic protein